MLLVVVCLVRGRRKESVASQHCPGAASRTIDHTPGAGGASGAEGREVCSGLELTRVLPLEELPSGIIALTLGNNRISEMSLGNISVFVVLQKP